MVDHARARSAPGYNYPEVGEIIMRETAVQIYQVQAADGVDWYQIGPGQWMERRYLRQVRINTTPPAGVTGGRWIEVNLYDQTLSVYDQGQLVFATMVASGGDPFFTRPGLFQVYQKKPLETMQGAFEADRSDFYYLEDVPWTMYFDQARALHGAYWRAWFGYAGTHGCVNLSIGDSAWLFQWAKEGDWVYVWDPSGETPTDPSLYTAGGA
jgi:lipoprotein-anchoring transpeptidase ErfK/SrfK